MLEPGGLRDRQRQSTCSSDVKPLSGVRISTPAPSTSLRAKWTGNLGAHSAYDSDIWHIPRGNSMGLELSGQTHCVKRGYRCLAIVSPLLP